MGTTLKTIKLDFPLLIGDKLLEKIEIKRRPVVKDLYGIKDLQNVGFESLMSIASRLTGIASVDMARLDFSDGVKVAEAMTSFLGSSPKTGEKQ